MNATNATIVDKISSIPLESFSDGLSSMFTMGFHAFMNYPVVFMLCFAIVVLGTAAVLSYWSDLFEGGIQTFLFGAVVYGLIISIGFVALLFIDMGEVGFWAGLS